MAKTTAEKLLIKPDTTVWCFPQERLGLLGPLPSGAEATAELADAAVAVAFVDDTGATQAFLKAHGDTLAAPDVLWVAYPKGDRSDLNRDRLWLLLADHAMRPIGQVAVDEEWSAMRFRPLREGEEFAPGTAPDHQ